MLTAGQTEGPEGREGCLAQPQLTFAWSPPCEPCMGPTANTSCIRRWAGCWGRVCWGAQDPLPQTTLPLTSSKARGKMPGVFEGSEKTSRLSAGGRIVW